MAHWAALLRGINVGGARRLAMADLRGLCAGLVWQRVESLGASGNLIFSTDRDTGGDTGGDSGGDTGGDARGDAAAAGALAAALAAVPAGRGGGIAVLVLPAAALRRALRDCPFATADPGRVHACFPFAEPVPDRALLEALRAPDEALELGGWPPWLHAPAGIGRSRLAQRIEAVLGVPATLRNLRSLARLAERLDARAGGC